MQHVDLFLNDLLGDPNFSKNISIYKTRKSQAADCFPFPKDFHPALVHGLKNEQIRNLYSHQIQSINLCKDGNNVVIVTGTASGKSLCYNIPVFHDILNNMETRALYLFPTKALAQDQFQKIWSLYQQILSSPQNTFPRDNTIAATYDGDTPKSLRGRIRNESSIIITNPDMLHLGILPHHTHWSRFFKGLKYIVLDEIHTYRGVFGSHVCNVIRRLKRIAKFYGVSLQFILTSATIGNPGELAEKLIEADVAIVNQDGSPQGDKHFIIYNPPIINPELNLRTNHSLETLKISKKLIQNQIQTIIFSQTRRSVELLLLMFQKDFQNHNLISPTIRSYRSGYLPNHRRELERGLKSGDIEIIITTTALELGIDCGSIGTVIMNGFPGTISGSWQQAGRSGRKSAPSVAILVTSSNPLDQFFARNPNFFFEQNPEKGLINPDNILILLEHIRCASYELPFTESDDFGSLENHEVIKFLDILERVGTLIKSNKSYYWASTGYPANNVSLRNASAARYRLVEYIDDEEKTVGEIDEESVFWMTHPDAIYLHEGDSYLVEDLDIKNKVVRLRSYNSDYYTKPKQEREINIIRVFNKERTTGGEKVFCEVSIQEQVIGYDRLHIGSSDIIDSYPLSLPRTEFITTGFLFLFSHETIDILRDFGRWSNDSQNYGSEWVVQNQKALERDHYTCQNCSIGRDNKSLHVHHKIPLRMFRDTSEANRIENLITLCASCHKKAEESVRVRSGLSGLAFIVGNLTPLYLMCDRRDLGVFFDPQSDLNHNDPVLLIFDRISGGLGFSREIFDSHKLIMTQAHSLINSCDCKDGCPTCVGPGGEFGLGSKQDTLAILENII